VLDAVMELGREGKVPLTAEMIAERSGVSVASIFRYFDGLDDLQVQAHRRFRQQFAPLMRPVTDGSLDERIAGLVGRRLDLYEQAGQLLTLARLRSLEHRPLLDALAENRAALAGQIRATFATEMAAGPPAVAAELVAAIDALTSLGSWDVLGATHARGRRQIERSWRRAIAALIADWTTGETR
jgi:AcrR family transcriptional regulator